MVYCYRVWGDGHHANNRQSGPITGALAGVGAGARRTLTERCSLLLEAAAACMIEGRSRSAEPVINMHAARYRAEGQLSPLLLCRGRRRSRSYEAARDRSAMTPRNAQLQDSISHSFSVNMCSLL